MKKKYVTPETELHFIPAQDIMAYSFNPLFTDEQDPVVEDISEWK